MEGKKDESKGGVKEESPQQSMEKDVARGGKPHKFGEEGPALKVRRKGG